MEQLRIDYDDNGLDIMDAVNECLAPYHLMFVNDEQDHDGYEIYALTETKEQP